MVGAFEFAAGIDEQPAVDGSVEKRNPGFIVEVHEIGKVGIAGDESASPSPAFLVHESSDALVDRREFQGIAEADAVFSGFSKHGNYGLYFINSQEVFINVINTIINCVDNSVDIVDK